jgi:Amidase
MSKSRREFLTTASIGLLGVTTAFEGKAEAQQPTDAPAGAPPAFGAGPAVGPEVSNATFAEAEKLVQVALHDDERSEAAQSWRKTMAALYERRTGPRKVALETPLAPYSRWDPVLPGQKAGPARDEFVRSNADPGPLPASDEDIAYAPVSKLSRWIEQRKLSSERLTQIYVQRIERLDPKLRCIITLPRDHALAQARKADTEIAAGKYRGPLHRRHCHNLWS